MTGLELRMARCMKMVGGDVDQAVKLMSAISSADNPASNSQRSASPSRQSDILKVIPLPAGDISHIKFEKMAVTAGEVYLLELTQRVGYSMETVVAEAPQYRAGLTLA